MNFDAEPRGERRPVPLSRLRSAALALCATLVLAPSCGREAPPAARREPPLLVVAVDGLEWDVLLPLLAEGRLPALEALARRGTYGLLETLRPTWSPVVWTTVATGLPPERHGIRDFSVVEDGERRPYTSADRRAKALWNLASEAGRRVAVVGWWASWPAEEVDGVVVTQLNVLGRGVAKGGLVEGLPRQTWPPELGREATEVLRRTEQALPALLAEHFGLGPDAPLGPLEARLWAESAWSVRADACYAELGERFLRERRPDLTMVYLGSPDVFGHRFWRYRAPELYAHPPSAEAARALGPLLDRDVQWIDGLIGRLVAAAGPDARVVVLSDHGMHPTGLDGRFAEDAGPGEANSAHHEDAPPGVLIAAGPDLCDEPGDDLPATRAGLRTLGSVEDVLPTLLALLDLPAGRDMPGRPMTAVIARERLSAVPPRRVPTLDDPAWRAARERAARGPDAAERLEQLRALGYLGSSPAPAGEGSGGG